VTIEQNDLPMRSAIDYFTRVSSNIATQKFASQWAPLNQRYREWKEFVFGDDKWWYMSGALQRSLTAFKTKDGWFGGVPGDATAPSWSWFGTRPGPPVSIAEYGFWTEYGRQGQAPRPLFVPTLEEFIEEGWPVQSNVTAIKIVEAWR